MGESILLLGASVRAAAQSCRRAGYNCHGADLFADQDTLPLAGFARVTDYPHDFPRISQEQPPGPWMYTGALENCPDLVDEISSHRPLLGVSGESLRRVRDPLSLHQALRTANLPTPLTTRNVKQLSPNHLWMCKPLRSAGGMNITQLNFRKPQKGQVSGNVYFQAKISGAPAAAVFVSSADRVDLLGVTRQLIGAEWTGANEFRYAGSIGPLGVGSACGEQIQQVGQLIARTFGLRGLFGIDGIIRNEQFWTVEVNPRYTASIEILERATGISAIAAHVAAFRGGEIMRAQREVPLEQHGKAIVFATHDVQVGEAFQGFVAAENHGQPNALIADIPHNGEVIIAGQPIATVFATGDSEVAVVKALQRRAERLRTSAGQPS